MNIGFDRFPYFHNGEILSSHMWLYGRAWFSERNVSQGELPDNLQTSKSWSEFNAGWLVGGCGGALFAYLLLTNSSLFF
ncbi:photosystem I reaction center subunit XI [Nostoc sp. CMAA1605]|uniref:photosystem I reaction center subunit XI n=1 Tax=Nostoc sp. CMAA1605 TaxID=2055159 RepID=UPI002E2FB96B|nr:photosystem I reaction center subunit XI [Nostoc sp. CMAA1605]